MKFLFFGTPYFAARLLDTLIRHDRIPSAIITREDKPQGRGRQLAIPAVKARAMQLCPDVPLYQPKRVSNLEVVEQLAKHHPDLLVVAAYGEILKQNLLNLPKLDPINVHASLLPKYRGAAPIQHALFHGDTATGITIMEMVAKLDAGPLLAQVSTPIDPEMNAGELTEKLADLAGPLLLEIFKQYEQGRVVKTLQDDALATFAPKIISTFCRIPWAESALHVHNRVRALAPKPGAWTESGGRRLKILRTHPLQGDFGKPGTGFFDRPGELIVACGEGGVKILTLQPEGKRILDIEEFLCGASKTTFSPFR